MSSAIEQLAVAGLADSDRYVRALTVRALRHDPNAAIPVWLDQVLGYLDSRQYQPLPASISR